MKWYHSCLQCVLRDKNLNIFALSELSRHSWKRIALSLLIFVQHSPVKGNTEWVRVDDQTRWVSQWEVKIGHIVRANRDHSRAIKVHDLVYRWLEGPWGTVCQQGGHFSPEKILEIVDDIPESFWEVGLTLHIHLIIIHIEIFICFLREIDLKLAVRSGVGD